MTDPAARRGRSLATLAALALLGCGLGACSAPQWRATAAPHGATLFVDGVAAGEAPLAGPIPYYGTVDLAAVPPPRPERSPGAPPLPRSTARARLEIDEPAPPWLFPLDFFLELAQLPFGEPVAPRVVVTTPPRQDVVQPGQTPADLDGLVERARAMQVQRGIRPDPERAPTGDEPRDD